MRLSCRLASGFLGCTLLAAAANAQMPAMGYSVDSNDTDHLWAIDLNSGAAADIGAVGFDGVDGLSFSPDGRLFAVDTATSSLITIDLGSGAGTRVGALGVSVSDVGLSFDTDGALWLIDETSASIFSVDPLSGAATLVGDTDPDLATGLTSFGPFLYALVTSPTDGLARIDVKKRRGAYVGDLVNVAIGNGGIAADPFGVLWGLNDSGVIFTIDLLSGEATQVATTLDDMEGLAISRRQTCAYSVDAAGTDHLWLIDLLSGVTLDIGAVGHSDVVALSFSSDGTLYGVDEGTDELITINTTNGTGALVGALGVDVTDAGIAFDGSGNLWMAESAGPSFYSVNTSTGAATLVGALGQVVHAIAADGATVYGLGEDAGSADNLVTIDTTTGLATAVGPLTNLTIGQGGLDFGPDGTLWGLAATDEIFVLSPTSGEAVLAAETETDFDSLAIAPCRTGLVALDVTKAAFTIDWSAMGQDTIAFAGQLNPNGLLADLSSATVEVHVNGSPLAPVATLDARGTFRSASGASPAQRLRLSPRDGKFAFAFGGIDLRSVVDFDNGTGEGVAALGIEVLVSGAGLVEPYRASLIYIPFKSRLDAGAKGKFALKKNGLPWGILHIAKAKAKEGANGHLIGFKGTLIPNGGGPLIPVDSAATADISIRIGQANPIEIPFGSLVIKGTGRKSSFAYSAKLGVVAGLKKFAVKNAGGSFTLSTNELAGTGIPAAGPMNGTSYVLPVIITVATAGGTESFEYNLELRRTVDTSTSWKR